jgi:hypothetical protein
MCVDSLQYCMTRAGLNDQIVRTKEFLHQSVERHSKGSPGALPKRPEQGSEGVGICDTYRRFSDVYALVVEMVRKDKRYPQNGTVRERRLGRQTESLPEHP